MILLLKLNAENGKEDRVDRAEAMEWASGLFMEQMGLDLSEILSIKEDKFVISMDNKLGLSMASLKLDLDDEGHGEMYDFLSLVSTDTT